MKLFATLAIVAYASSPVVFGDGNQIECYHCEYSWEVYAGLNQSIKGEASCADGPLDLVPTKSKKETVEKDDGFSYKNRCGYAHTIGQETVHDGDKLITKEFHIFERKAFKVALDSSLVDHNGELIMEEDGRMCGANRTECGGVQFFNCKIVLTFKRHTTRDNRTRHRLRVMLMAIAHVSSVRHRASTKMVSVKSCLVPHEKFPRKPGLLAW